MGDARTPILVGPTGVGKTAIAEALAAHWPMEVISADSRQIYRGLDIATAKFLVQNEAIQLNSLSLGVSTSF